MDTTEALPFLLAGPIVRRSEPTAISVWMATSQDAPDATLRVTAAGQVWRGAAERVRLGERLWVHLFVVGDDKRPFPEDTVLAYAIEVPGQDLEAAHQALAYGDAQGPTIVLRSRLTRVAFGSCRKPHLSGSQVVEGGTPDGFVALDAELAAVGPQDRPAPLFLAGDQIYADDVAEPLAAALLPFAHTLTGAFEPPLPGGPVDEAPARRPRSLGQQLARWVRWDEPPNSRAARMRAAGFSTRQNQHHLMTFGEFAAMYVTAWGWVDLDLPGVPPGLHPRDAARYEAQRSEVAAWLAARVAVRRVLANCVTYMVFDDHELSDDWNIARRWEDGVRNTEDGRRIVANGLAAFWAFQAWGNTPGRWSPRLVAAITDHLGTAHTKRAHRRADRYDRRLWNVRGWGFAVPSHPPAFVLDTRTQRAYHGDVGAPMLMDRYGLDWLAMAWADLLEALPGHEDAPEGVIIVSATPVYGFEPLETIQRLASFFDVLNRWFRVIGAPAALDFESWVANEQGFGALMRTLLERMQVKRVLFLSGDVHYSFANQARFRARLTRNGTSRHRVLHAAQATASPLHNHTAGRGLAKLLSLHFTRSRHRFGSFGEPPIWFVRFVRDRLIQLTLVWHRAGRKQLRRLRYWTDGVRWMVPTRSDAADASLLEDANGMGLVTLDAQGRPLCHELLVGEGPGRVTWTYGAEEEG